MKGEKRTKNPRARYPCYGISLIVIHLLISDPERTFLIQNGNFGIPTLPRGESKGFTTEYERKKATAGFLFIDWPWSHH